MIEALDLFAISRSFERTAAIDILKWASENLGQITFATGFGAEGCVIMDLIGRHDLKIDLFTLDTGVLFPETYDLWQRLETRYGFKIRGVKPELSIEQQAEAHGAALWEREPDKCCEMRKVKPLRQALVGFDSWITALRRDQTPERANAQIVERDRKLGLVKCNPLANWTHDQVWAHVYAFDVPYNPLHEQGYPSIGCQPCTSAVVPGENLRAGRWRGNVKKECGIHVADGAEEKPAAESSEEKKAS
jgi:phosphoadenosine phosphosulfate reductase